MILFSKSADEQFFFLHFPCTLDNPRGIGQVYCNICWGLGGDKPLSLDFLNSYSIGVKIEEIERQRFITSQTSENVAGRSVNLSYTSAVVQDAWELQNKSSSADFEKRTVFQDSEHFLDPYSKSISHVLGRFSRRIQKWGCGTNPSCRMVNLKFEIFGEFRQTL